MNATHLLMKLDEAVQAANQAKPTADQPREFLRGVGAGLCQAMDIVAREMVQGAMELPREEQPPK